MGEEPELLLFAILCNGSLYRDPPEACLPSYGSRAASLGMLVRADVGSFLGILLLSSSVDTLYTFGIILPTIKLKVYTFGGL